MEETRVENSAEQEFFLAQEALAGEDAKAALVHIERALKLRDVPQWYSYLGFCVARQRGQHRKGLELCQASLAIEPDNPAHYLNLGMVYLVKGDKTEALRVLRQGMAKGGSPALAQQLDRLGMRKGQLFPALSRSNPLNRYLGILLSRLGLR